MQSFRDFEHIVVDGRSGDGTPEWLAAQGDSIRWISEPDCGIAHALNKALAMAQGDYVLVLHAEDTLISPVSLAEAARELDGSEIVGFDVLFSTTKGDRLLHSSGFSPKLAFKTTVPHQGSFCQRTLFDRIGVFDKTFRIALDYEFFLRAHRSRASIRCIDRPLTRMPDTGISSRLDWPSLRDRFAEERRAQLLHCPGPLMRGVYAVYWPPYLAYRRLRCALSDANG